MSFKHPEDIKERSSKELDTQLLGKCQGWAAHYSWGLVDQWDYLGRVCREANIDIIQLERYVYTLSSLLLAMAFR